MLTPPSTNDSLKNVQGAAIYTGQTRIVLSGTTHDRHHQLGLDEHDPDPEQRRDLRRQQHDDAPAATPTRRSRATRRCTRATSACGNVYVSGTYSGQLTIAAENDIIVDNDLCRGSCSSSPSGNGLLGLIANNFIRVFHPVTPTGTHDHVGQLQRHQQPGSGSTPYDGGTQTNLRIDAAMLAIQHSFIVDHYNCGSPLGTLTVNGAISQKFRGPVGTVSGTTASGYSKNYTYDDRLRYLSPPNFLDPVESAWHMQRQTIDP